MKIAAWVRIPLCKVNSRPILLKDCLYSPSIRVCVHPQISPPIWEGFGGNRNYSTSIGGERVKMKQESTDFNKQWFIGFCDAESSFSINPVVNSENFIKKILCLVLNCTKMI